MNLTTCFAWPEWIRHKDAEERGMITNLAPLLRAEPRLRPIVVCDYSVSSRPTETVYSWWT